MNSNRIVLSLLIAALTVLFSTTASAQKRYIQLEVAVSNRAPVETQQRWMKMLSEVGADRVRSVTAGASATVKISDTPSSGSERIKINGAIQDGKLILPGKTFTIRDKIQIKDYIQQLRDDGIDVALAEKKAFGLTSQQLVDVNTLLTEKLKFETLNQSSSQVVRKIGRGLGGLVLDSSARKALKRDEPILDELEGLSLGTSLAAIARPLGLVLVPKRQRGGEVELHLVDYKDAEEHWPIGWPSPAIPKKMVPSLFAKFPIEVREYPADQVLKVIQSKAKVPMLYDFNSLARAEIDLSKTAVTFVKANSTYIFALRKVLNQTKPRMAYEIRVDETGRPFLWLSTAVRVK